MIPSHVAQDRLPRAFAPTQGGVVGLTDQLLAACVGTDVEFRRVGDRCVSRWTVGGETDEVPVPLPPAAFRTILARVAALCNEHTPDAVTPYGGEGLLTVKGPPQAVVRVRFVNTPDEQRLDVYGIDRATEVLEKARHTDQPSSSRTEPGAATDPAA